MSILKVLETQLCKIPLRVIRSRIPWPRYTQPNRAIQWHRQPINL